MPTYANGEAAAGHPGLTGELAAVRRAARGSRRDFALDPRPIARGGQATVFGAVHKPTGVRVAFKRLDGRRPDVQVRMRMRREVEAARLFGGHPHVLPVLDWSPSHDWFVMPLADGTARALAGELSEPAVVRALVTAICEALREPHRQGWVHRDLKPDNVLRFAGRWVVADWGLGRRPRGQTTDPRRTQEGVRIGTEGFAAPELSVDAHAAGPQADIYSIGQMIGWALTGEWPQPNLPLVPASRPWRTIVRAATLHDLDRRVATVDELLAMVAVEFDAPAESLARGKQLLSALGTGDRAALVELFRLAARSDLSHDFFRDVLLPLDPDQRRAAVSADPHTVGEVVRAVHFLYSNESREDPGRAVTWLLAVAQHAESLGNWDLLDDAADAVLRLDASGRLDPDAHGRVAAWLSAGSGEAASVIAAVLRRSPPHLPLLDLANDRALDRRIRLALRPRTPAEATRPVGETGPAAIGHGPARRRPVLLSGAVVAVVILIITLLRIEGPGQHRNPAASSPNESAIAGLPGVPSELADSPSLREFVKGWDLFPGWSRCRSGSGDTALTGSFPAHKARAGLPEAGIYCTNGGNLTVMFAEFKPAAYGKVADAYFNAAPARRPVGGERNPPPGLHVFAWSSTQRALVWADRKVFLIGVAVTDSRGTDLVQLWSRYR